MRASLRFDHVVLVTPRLEAAVEAHRAAGFTVLPGGRHDALPTENALIAFADGSYLELLAFRDAATRDELRALAATPRWERHLHEASAVARRFLPPLATREGVADLVFAHAGLARFASEARRRGGPVAGPVAMERRRPDGATLAWDLLLPADFALPFFIEDRTPRALRVAQDAPSVTHANGARGVSALKVRTPSVVATAMAWADLLGATPRAERDGTTWLEVAGVAIELVEGEPRGAFEATIAGVAELPGPLREAGLHPGP